MQMHSKARMCVQAAAAGPATLASKTAPGVYMPPFRLAQLMAAEAAQDKTGPQYQRLTWDALRKSINALVNKVTAQNVKNILHELFREVGHTAGIHAGHAGHLLAPYHGTRIQLNSQTEGCERAEP